ncbi:MAG: ribonuclease HII [Actinomycetota bacterium]
MDLSHLTLREIGELFRSASDEAKRELLSLLEGDKRAGALKLASSIRKELSKEEQEKADFLKLCTYEHRLWRKGFSLIAGVDEAGRGALAGPLVAAAVILPQGIYLPGLRECKQLLPQQREELYRIITRSAVNWNVATLDPQQIDIMGLQKANLFLLSRAVLGLSVCPHYILSDAFSLINLKEPHLSLISGDKVSISIAAASIIAKVTRDHLMKEYHKKFPLYHFDHNKGYGTREHLQALKRFGPCPIHRHCFTPVKERVSLKFVDQYNAYKRQSIKNEGWMK